MSDWAGVTTPPTVWTASCWTTPSMGAASRWMRARCAALTTSWASDAARVSTSASSARRVRLNSISTTCPCVRASPRAARSRLSRCRLMASSWTFSTRCCSTSRILQPAHELVVEQLPVGRGALGQHRHDQLQPLAVGLGRLGGGLALLDEESRGVQTALVLPPLVEEPVLLQGRQPRIDPFGASSPGRPSRRARSRSPSSWAA